MKTPIIFLAFANDRDDYLEMLKEESTQIFDALANLKQKGFIDIHREESADIDSIFRRFSMYKDDISIFHYGGHSNGTQLMLEGYPGNAEGLAQLMGQQPNLKLVFLNGCSSRGQVQSLLDAGVPAIVASSIEIEDRSAMNFAKHFYMALSNGRTIDQAFGYAQSHLMTTRKTIAPNYMDDLPAWGTSSHESFAWELYINPGIKEEILKWRLPYYKSIRFTDSVVQYISASFSSNRFIVQYVLEEMCRYNPDILDEMYELKLGERVKKDSSQYPWILIENFPWPIGAQILKLFQFKQPGLDRLEQLVSTYLMTSKVLYYIILSDLWSKCRSSKGHERWKGIAMDKVSYLEFDFLSQITLIYNQASKYATPFVNEYDSLIKILSEKDGLIHRSHLYLESLRRVLLNESPQGNFESLCEKAEQALVHILKAAAFLSCYQMLTVRYVGVFRPRFALPEYELDMGPLNASHDSNLSLYKDAERRKKSTISDSTSIILTPSEDSMDESLNLSPFIMDKNTFAQVKRSESNDQDKIPHIFILGWIEDDELHYLDVKHNIFTAVNRASDQVHTGMTLNDFLDGLTIPDNEVEQIDFGFEQPSFQETSSPKVFQLLKDQFDMLIADLKD